jgi:uncharacterized protein
MCGKLRWTATWVKWRAWWGTGPPRCQDSRRHDALDLGRYDGKLELVRWLLENGAAIDERDDAGRTALWGACARGEVPVVRLLMERGADPTIATEEFRLTPLMVASYEGYPEVVRVLLRHPVAKRTINHRGSSGQTALLKACFWGRGGSVRVLLEGGADPTIVDDNGTTAMAIATRTLTLTTTMMMRSPPRAAGSAWWRLR